jgi:hypothetical protein
VVLRLALLSMLVPGVVLTSFVGSAAAASCTTPAGVQTCVFNYTGAAQTWLVPAGGPTASFDVFGAQGGGLSAPLAGGLCGRATATIHALFGDSIQVNGGCGEPRFEDR